jgi:hypothetical protein
VYSRDDEFHDERHDLGCEHLFAAVDRGRTYDDVSDSAGTQNS